MFQSMQPYYFSRLTLKALKYRIYFFTLAAAIINFEWVEITHVCTISIQANANLGKLFTGHSFLQFSCLKDK